MDKKWTDKLKYGMLCLAFVILFVFAYSRMKYFINSDYASELILSKMLREDGGILSSGWFYSTELRVLNTQLVFALLFHITDNWQIVRIAGTVILWLLLLASVFYFSYQAGIKRYFPILGLLLLLPFSEQYFLYVVMGVYYIPHLIIAFLTLGMLFHMDHLSMDSGKGRIVLLGLNMLLALIAGMGGMRELFVLYVPLFLAGIMAGFKSGFHFALEKWAVKVSGLLLIFSGIGYIINSKILSRYYSFKSFGDIQWKYFRFENVQDLINGFLYFHGWRKDRAVLSTYTLNNITCMGILILVTAGIIWYVRNGTKPDQRFRLLLWFYLISGFMFIGLYLMTDMGYLHRYWILTLIWELPLLLHWYDRCDNASVKKTCHITLGLVVLSSLIVYCGYGKLEWNFLEFYPDNQGKEEIIATLEEEGYVQGYATFWNANVMTELSNGKIEMWALPDSLSSYEVYPWLQKKEHQQAGPNGRYFVMFSEEELGSPLWEEMSDEQIIYTGNGYVIYGVANNEQN